jgi:hypothetical protein
MRFSPCLLALALLVLAPGCKKPKPSPEYAEASGAYSTLTAKLGDDAYADPEMTRIEGLLQSVPADSLDAAAAKELFGKIQAERKRVADEAAAQKRLLEAAERPSLMIDSPRTPDEAPRADAADAGSPGKIARGMTTEEVSKASDDCVAFTQKLRVRNPDGSEADAVIWERRNLGKCRDAFPELADRLLVFEHDKLEQVVDKSLITHEVLKPDAGQAAEQAPQPKQEGAPTAQPSEPPTDTAPPIPSKLPPPVPPGENTGTAPTE